MSKSLNVISGIKKITLYEFNCKTLKAKYLKRNSLYRNDFYKNRMKQIEKLFET